MELSKDYTVSGLYIEITSSCNLRCIHCYNDSGKNSYDMKTKDIENLLNSLNDNSVTIALSGGEPLLNKDIWDILSLLNDKKIRTILITNGTLISDDYAKKLSIYNVPPAVQVSLNGSTPEIHDLICGQGNYNKTLNGLKNLLKYIDPKTIAIHSIITKYSWDNIPDFIKQVNDMGITDISFNIVNFTGRAQNTPDNIFLSFRDIKDKIPIYLNNSYISNLISNGVKIDFPKLSFGCPLVGEVADNSIDPNVDKRINLRPRIDYKGDVYLCQSLCHEEYSFGNIYKNNLSDILVSDKLIEVQNFVKFSREYIPECVKCVWKTTCNKGCPADSLNIAGDICRTDGACDIRSRMFLENLKSTS